MVKEITRCWCQPGSKNSQKKSLKYKDVVEERKTWRKIASKSDSRMETWRKKTASNKMKSRMKTRRGENSVNRQCVDSNLHTIAPITIRQLGNFHCLSSPTT